MLLGGVQLVRVRSGLTWRHVTAPSTVFHSTLFA